MPTKKTTDRWTQEVIAAGFIITTANQVEVPCTRCGGSGNYSFNMMHGSICFGCSGAGRSYQSIERVSKRLRQRASAKRCRANRVARERLEGLVNGAEFIQGDDELRLAMAGSGNPFIRSIARQLMDKGSVSDKQRAAVIKARAGERKFVAAKQHSDEVATPIPDDIVGVRSRVAGRVASAKWQSSNYGYTLKMLVIVETDLGEFKLWGSVPSGIESLHYDLKIDPDSDLGEDEDDTADWIKGKRVAFDAKVERGDRDESFGFFSRPTKPELLAAEG